MYSNGRIRKHGGNNNNPYVLQFRAAYKKVLSHLELRLSYAGDCISLDNFTILNASSIHVINSTSVMSRHDDEDFTVLENEVVMDSDRQVQINCSIFSEILDTERLT